MPAQRGNKKRTSPGRLDSTNSFRDENSILETSRTLIWLGRRTSRVAQASARAAPAAGGVCDRDPWNYRPALGRRGSAAADARLLVAVRPRFTVAPRPSVAVAYLSHSSAHKLVNHTAHCPPPTAHCPLPTAHCPLPTATSRTHNCEKVFSKKPLFSRLFLKTLSHRLSHSPSRKKTLRQSQPATATLHCRAVHHVFHSRVRSTARCQRDMISVRWAGAIFGSNCRSTFQLRFTSSVLAQNSTAKPAR